MNELMTDACFFFYVGHIAYLVMAIIWCTRACSKWGGLSELLYLSLMISFQTTHRLLVNADGLSIFKGFWSMGQVGVKIWVKYGLKIILKISGDKLIEFESPYC